MTRVATATSSQSAADAARQVADGGGNAIDCALAAALVTMNTEPGVCSMAGGAYVTVWPADGDPVTIDGNVAVPGRGAATRELAPQTVSMDYGGGITTLVGASSVAVPGALAAIEQASRCFGLLPWRELLQPCIAAVRDGFPLSNACHYYLQYSATAVFGRSKEGHAALCDATGRLRNAGEIVLVPGLADTLQGIAEEGSELFYSGEIAAAMAAHVSDGGGRLTRDDLAQYRAILRSPLLTRVGDWRIAGNPPPAVGGTVLSALLSPFHRQPAPQRNPASLARIIDIQRAVLRYRRERLDLSPDVSRDCTELLNAIDDDRFPGKYTSSSTVHSSAADETGNACAITASAGYGSGEMPAGTGLWLNNCLGEIELNRRGLNAGPVGSRLPSNMAPGAARTADQVLAFGSPGADRITTALQQFLLAFLQQGLSLADAVAAPRLHVELPDSGEQVAAEPGLDLPPLSIPVREYPTINMYFGGVAAVLSSRTAGFEVAADPRREGGTSIGGE